MENLAFDPNCPFPKREDFTERETHLIMEAFEAGKRDERIGLTEKIEGMKLKEPFHDENSIVHNDALNAVLDLLTK